MGDTSEQTIKPGDVVRYDHDLDPRGGRRYIVGVIDHGWATIAGPGFVLDAPLRMLHRLEPGTEDGERAAVLQVAELHTGDHRRLARVEALRRGWRELDREDVTIAPTAARVEIAGMAIGVVDVAGDAVRRWAGRLYEDPFRPILCDAAGNELVTIEQAVDALIAAENARRAKGRTDG